MIDIASERLIRFCEASKHIPGRPHVSALYRWLKHPVHPIETVLVGGRRWTSVEAIERFVARCSGEAVEAPAATSARRHREIADAEKRLDAAGVR